MPAVAVFDTNVLFSASGAWRGSPYQCLQLVRDGRAALVVCAALLNELEEKLQQKLGFSASRATALVDDIATIARIVRLTGTLRIVQDDPDDDMVIEQASHIVTGDSRHLLSMKMYQGSR